MSRLANCCAALLLAFAAGPSWAKSGWTIDIPSDAAPFTANPSCKDPNKAEACLVSQQEHSFEDGSTITVTCQSKAVCDDISLMKMAGTKPVSEIKGKVQSADGKTLVYTLDGRSDIKTLTTVGAFHGGKTSLLQFDLKPSLVVSTPPAKSATGSLEDSLRVNVASIEQCPGQLEPSYRPDDGYGHEVSSYTVYTDVLGSIVAAPADASFDENDHLIVKVIGDQGLLERMKVERTSTIRDVTIVRNIGEGTQAPTITDQAEVVEEPACAMRTFDGIKDFAPGKGVVQLSYMKGDTKVTSGTFEINVAPLYSGIFTLGAARTSLVDTQFKVVSDGAQNVIARADESDKDTMYSVFYTPFVWGKRDPEKSFQLKQFYRHINPTIGISVDNLKDNAFVGLSFDLPVGLLVTYGRHFRKVTVLSEKSGLEVGDPFNGTSSDLPTASSWEDDNFVAVSIDIRVMSQLIRSAIGGGSGS